MPSCNTSWATSFACSGFVTKCNGCGDYYCAYHQPGCKSTRVIGGHACSRPCSTTNVPNFVANCCGELRKCQYCKDMYCQYHYHANAKESQVMGGHVCEKMTQQDLPAPIRAVAGSVGGVVQAVANRFGEGGRWKREVEKGVSIHDEYCDMRCPASIGEGCVVIPQKRTSEFFPYSPMVTRNGKKIPKMWVDVENIFGNRLCPVDIEDMLTFASQYKVVVVSMNWAFVDQAAYLDRQEVLRGMLNDPSFKGHRFIICNDQVGEAMGTSYTDEVNPFRSEKVNNRAQNKWPVWFIGLVLADQGVCIAQTLPDGRPAVTENTAREFLAMSNKTRDFQFFTYGF